MTDPKENFDSSARPKPAAISQKVYTVAGIQLTVFGLDELHSQTACVACLWLLHPRLATQESMAGIATACISDWNSKDQQTLSGKGLIAVSFDQRNHGTRLVDPLANEALAQGNPRHALDMFSIFQGTAQDVSVLMDYLAAYIFPGGEHGISQNLVLGVSLGAHASWSCLLHERRISAGVIIIGCPDYINLMVDRARLSGLPLWTKSNTPGSRIPSSGVFPASFLESVRQYDPASKVLGQMNCGSWTRPLCGEPFPYPTAEEQQALRPLLMESLAGKRILNLYGGVDELVPYHCGEAFLTWLKKAVSPDGWFADGAVTFEDIVDEAAGHEVTPKMVDQSVRFISETLAAVSTNGESRGSVQEMKI